MKTKHQHAATIKQLRQAGHKVRCYHERPVVFDKKQIKKLLKPQMLQVKKGNFTSLQDNPVAVPISRFVMSHGGRTVVEVTSKNGNDYSAVAVTSKKDIFNKSVGIFVCIGRILVAAENNNDKLV
jgi:hypothetical protein